MTRLELEIIVKRDMPGWVLAKDSPFPKNPRETTLLKAQMGSVKKAVVFSEGFIIGEQG